MMCAPPLFTFACYFCTFGDTALWFGHLVLETATTKFTVKMHVCFNQAAEYGVANLFIPARIRALSEGGQLCGNERVQVPLSIEMRANVLKRVQCALTPY